MKFYHGTNEYGLLETQKQKYLLHQRGDKMDPCTYLTPDLEIAKIFGDIILEVNYDPFKNPKKNNYRKGCWQLRVYEPIYEYMVYKR